MHHKPNFKKELTDAWHVALLKRPTMHHVAEDGSKTTMGYYIIIAAAILGLIGQQFFSMIFQPTLGFSILMAVVQVVTTIVGIYVLSYVAKSVFKGHAKHDHFFRVIAYGVVVTWLGLIPHLALIGSIWVLVIIFVALKSVHKLTTGGAIGTLLITLIVMMVFSALLTPIYSKFGMSQMMNGQFKFKGAGNYMLDNKEGKMEFDSNTVKFTNEKGEEVEWKIPKFDD